MLKVSDFAEERHVDRNAVTQYIRRHPEIFDGHTRRDGNQLLVDEEAVEALNRQYPLPQLVEVVEDKESRQKLILAQEKIIQLQEQMAGMAQIAAQADAQRLLLEDTKERLQDTEKRLQEAQEGLKAVQAELMSTREELASERSKSWLQKLFRK